MAAYLVEVSPRILLGLFIANLIWSAHPAMGKLVLSDLSPAQAAWARYASAWIAYALGSLALRRVPRLSGKLPRPFLRPDTAMDWVLVASLGLLTFCFSPLMQLTGLSASQATDNALIIAMEPMMTVILAWLVLGESLTRAHIVSFALALAGFGLLTGLSVQQLSGSWDGHLIGNFIMLLSLVGEATYSILGRKLTDRYPPTGILGTALTFGTLALTAAVMIHLGPGALWIFPKLSWRSLLGILWLGPLGSALTYLFWMIAVTEAPVASLALTLFIQPLFGSLWGILFLHDRLRGWQAFGGALILAAVLGQGWAETRDASRQGPKKSD
jgi:drug/metabolite transporter (DMT)-like permease